MPKYSFEPIGYIRSCFKEKFGIPRQSGLVKNAVAILEIHPPYSSIEAFRRLSSFSHIWILFVFHKNLHQRWKATVRPPRLGGNQRVGVFATRSGFRPNAIGQSAVELISLETIKGKTYLHLGGVDLMDATPVLDIKPYLPYTDAIIDAEAGYARQQPTAKWPVIFSHTASQKLEEMDQSSVTDLRRLITDLIALDPRPGYQAGTTSTKYGMRLWDLNIKFQFNTDHILVDAIDTVDYSA